MKIALIGYGKMGKMIEQVALDRGHEVVLRINIENTDELTPANLSRADVAIEFTGPDSAEANVVACLNNGTPVVSGSTGWNQKLEAAKSLCKRKDCSFLHASNFSIGVNIFFELNRKLGELMSKQKDYEVSMKEIHHTEKKDAPSGTAVTLAEQLFGVLPGKTKWVNTAHGTSSEIPIESERVDPAPGTHVVKYSSDIDDIEIIHTAHNRKGFALGAVLAAEFIHNRKGVFTMKEVLSL